MKSYPLIKFTLLFTAGILAGEKLVPDKSAVFIIFLILFASFLLILLFDKNEKMIFTANIFSFFLVFTMGLTTAGFENKDADFIPEKINRIKDAAVYGVISKIDLPDKNGFKFVLKSDSIYAENIIYHKPVKIYCSAKDFSKRKLDSLYNILLPGKNAIIKGIYHKARDRRNPGEFDYNQYLRSQGISGILNIYSAEDIKIVSNDYNLIGSIIFSIRKNIDSKLSELFEPETAGLLRGLLLADRSEINYETKNEFINSGVVHVLAVSGLHVGFIALIFFIILGRFNLYFRSIITILALLAFMVITGIPPSVFRATIMAAILIIAFLYNRSTNIFNSLALAALIILLFRPSDIFTPGFQLSFSAVLSIAVLYPILREEINRFNITNKYFKGVLLFGAVSLSAQIGTMPFTFYYFGKLSLVSLFANILVIPLIGIIIAVAFVSLLISTFASLAAIYFAAAEDLFVKLLTALVHFAGGNEYSFLWIRNFSFSDAIIFYLLIVMFFLFNRKFEKPVPKIILSILIITNIGLFTGFDDPDLLPDGKLNLVMIDVGQGDSFLLKLPNGKTALIDAGDVTASFDNGERVILPLLNNLGIKKIDYGYISHIDADHYAGFVSLIHKNKIARIVKPAVDTANSKDIRFERYLRSSGVPFRYYTDTVYSIGNVSVCELSGYNFIKGARATTNNGSGLLKVKYGNTSALFCGDIEAPAEKYYSKHYGKLLDADVLKISHHGSKTGSSEPFLEMTTPGISLISAGLLNRFGHPSLQTLKKLNKIHSKIYRTDHSGAVILSSDGNKFIFKDWRKNY